MSGRLDLGVPAARSVFGLPAAQRPRWPPARRLGRRRCRPSSPSCAPRPRRSRSPWRSGSTGSPVSGSPRPRRSGTLLTGCIDREHPALRGMLKRLRQELATWKHHVYVGAIFREAEPSEVVPAEQLGPDGTLTSVWTGPVGQLPPQSDMDNFVGDWHYAKFFSTAACGTWTTIRSRSARELRTP